MDADPVTIPDWIDAAQAWDDFFLRYHGWPWFAVVAGDGRFVGLAHRDAVERAARARPETPMHEVATPGDEVRDDASLEVLLASEPLRRLGALMAVDADGRLRGVVTLDQVSQALRARLAAS
jgi:CBS domain-containing protein